MDLNTLKKAIIDRTPKPEGDYQYFSVLAPLIEVNDELHLLFEVRSEKLKTQPREICFPGGRIEPNETAMDCAIRETSEELNLLASHIKVYGALDFLVLPYNLVLYPFLGSLNIALETIDFSRDEVAEIFTVPLKYFMENPPLSHPIEIQILTGEDFPYHLLENGDDYRWKNGKYPVYFYLYEDYVIWGMTARIVKNLIDILNID